MITFSYRQSDFLRRFRYDEFPVTRTNQRKVYNYLTEHMRPNDIILTNSQTSFYLICYQLPNQPRITYTSWVCRKYAWKGFNCFDIMGHYGFDKIEIVTGALRGINKHVDLEKGSKVWLVNIGWGGDEIETFLSKDPEYRFLFNKELSVEGGCIHSVKTEDIIQIIPHAPTNLIAETVASGEINLNWQDDSNNEEKFEIWRSGDPSHWWWTKIAEVSSNSTTYKDKQLNPNKEYCYVVFPCNPSGCSDESNAACDIPDPSQ